MSKALIVVLAAGLALAAPPAVAGLLSATGEVIAIVAGELFVGEAEGHLDGHGTLSIRSQSNPQLSCQGAFTSSAKLGGSGALHCTDGSAGTFQFQRLSLRRGHGTGSLSRRSMSFAYGLSAEEAKPYLVLPAGKALSQTGTELRMVEVNAR
jgi:hypothetical protein